MWRQYCQVIWVAEYLKLPSCCDLCNVPPLSVDKVLADADELRAYLRGYFVIAHRMTKRQPQVKAGVSRLENESFAEHKQMVMRWVHVLA